LEVGDNACGGLFLAVASFASFAASEFEGTWAVKNTRQSVRDYALRRRNGDLDLARVRNWHMERRGGVAVISWKWVDQQDRQRGRQVREDGFRRRAADGPPTNTSDAVKK
jgi:hypothetical protein